VRIAAIVTLCVASLLANPVIIPEADMGVLTIWPTARSTALAGAMAGLADEADATYFNPAGLAFQTTAKADITYANWLPGLYEGMYYAFAAGGAPLQLPFLRGRHAYIAGSLTYMTLGGMDIVNERGEFLGRVDVWRGAAAAHAGLELTNTLGVGLGLKLVRSSYYDWWYWWNLAIVGPRSAAWIPDVNAATTAAVDLAILYRPVPQISIGAAVANLGPHVVYRPIGEVEDLPRMAKLGLCWTPIENRNVRLRVIPKLTKILANMFNDTTGTKAFGRKLGDEWRDVWKAVGVEATAFDVVSFRLGYFEDMTNQRGGIVLEKEGQTYHYGVWDVLTRKHLGTFERVGLCWGFGIGTDRLRFDFSSDAAIYDFPTRNWKFQLTCNNIGGLFCGRS